MPASSAPRWIVTTRDAALREAAAPELRPLVIRAMADAPAVMVRTSETRQTIEGFGVCFNELGWTALQRLSSEERRAILDELFSPAGMGLTVCRMPVGANDFSTDWYSYDEEPGDLALEHFSIEHDRATLVPFIREALARQSELRLWASPWSPPSWMKRNGHYAAALPLPDSGVENGLAPDQVGVEGTDLFRVDEPAYLDAYARYFGRFVDAYAAEGIRIGAVMPQNEFNSPQVFPSCTWTSEGLARFVAVLGPVMAARGVEVFLGTQERADPDQTLRVLADPEAARWIVGAGFQWAGKGAIAAIHREAPRLRLYQTEQECGDGRNDWRFARYAWTLLRHFLTSGANAYVYWNLALDEGGVSRWGWAQNSLVVVDPASGTARYTHEYALLKHVSGFVRPGAVRLEAFSWSGYENQLAFRNPDGEIVVVVQNDGADELPYSVAIDDRRFDVVLPADSFSTFVVPA
ncbi:glycoside hydrolase family 30 beta sandwich domain-containing protein [Microbacterium sp. X-17]